MSLKEDFDYQVLNLTQDFYTNYPSPPYDEIMKKDNRPYNCLLIQSHYDYFICIPYRTQINHKYAYKFKHSQRSKKAKSGLDYSKMAIIKNSDYISNSDAVVDKDEYKETRDNIEYIRNDAEEYINDYIGHVSGSSKKYDSIEFNRVYKYSTLAYFHKELGLEN